MTIEIVMTNITETDRDITRDDRDEIVITKRFMRVITRSYRRGIIRSYRRERRSYRRKRRSYN